MFYATAVPTAPDGERYTFRRHPLRHRPRKAASRCRPAANGCPLGAPSPIAGQSAWHEYCSHDDNTCFYNSDADGRKGTTDRFRSAWNRRQNLVLRGSGGNDRHSGRGGFGNTVKNSNDTRQGAVVRKPSLPVALFRSAVISLTLASTAAAATGRSDWQALDDIQDTATDFLAARMGAAGDGTRIEAGFLDPRLRLPRCSQPLAAFLNPGADVNRITTVGVRCQGEKPWKVYVPVSVVATADVAVATRHLPRGSVITADSLRLERREVTRMRSGYFGSIEAALGLRVRQSILKGRALTPGQLEADHVVRRGQSVTLVVASGGLKLNMAGKALIDGALGQRIRVENSSSGRVVEGIVRSHEHVEILAGSRRAFFSGKAKALRPKADTPVSNNDR